MSSFTLDALGLWIDAPRCSYQDLGLVHDLQAAKAKAMDSIIQKHCIARSSIVGNCSVDSEVIGHAFVVNIGGRYKEVVTMAKDMGDEISNLAIAGHEQTHALDYMGGLPILERLIRDSGRRIRLPKRRSDNNAELVAQIGSVLALERAGHNPLSAFVYHDQGRYATWYKEALNILTEAKTRIIFPVRVK